MARKSKSKDDTGGLKGPSPLPLPPEPLQPEPEVRVKIEPMPTQPRSARKLGYAIAQFSKEYVHYSKEQLNRGLVKQGHIFVDGQDISPGQVYALDDTQELQDLLKKGILYMARRL